MKKTILLTCVLLFLQYFSFSQKYILKKDSIFFEYDKITIKDSLLFVNETVVLNDSTLFLTTDTFLLSEVKIYNLKKNHKEPTKIPINNENKQDFTFVIGLNSGISVPLEKNFNFTASEAGYPETGTDFGLYSYLKLNKIPLGLTVQAGKFHNPQNIFGVYSSLLSNPNTNSYIDELTTGRWNNTYIFAGLILSLKFQNNVFFNISALPGIINTTTPVLYFKAINNQNRYSINQKKTINYNIAGNLTFAFEIQVIENLYVNICNKTIYSKNNFHIEASKAQNGDIEILQTEFNKTTIVNNISFGLTYKL